LQTHRTMVGCRLAHASGFVDETRLEVTLEQFSRARGRVRAHSQKDARAVMNHFATMLIEASKGASVRMPDGLTGDDILEWFSLPWDEAVRRDPTFRERRDCQNFRVRAGFIIPA
jgi:hypothetical protein